VAAAAGYRAGLRGGNSVACGSLTLALVLMSPCAGTGLLLPAVVAASALLML
jgi:hypothetical protein